MVSPISNKLASQPKNSLFELTLQITHDSLAQLLPFILGNGAEVADLEGELLFFDQRVVGAAVQAVGLSF